MCQVVEIESDYMVACSRDVKEVIDSQVDRVFEVEPENFVLESDNLLLKSKIINDICAKSQNELMKLQQNLNLLMNSRAMTCVFIIKFYIVRKLSIKNKFLLISWLLHNDIIGSLLGPPSSTV